MFYGDAPTAFENTNVRWVDSKKQPSWVSNPRVLAYTTSLPNHSREADTFIQVLSGPHLHLHMHLICNLKLTIHLSASDCRCQEPFHFCQCTHSKSPPPLGQGRPLLPYATSPVLSHPGHNIHFFTVWAPALNFVLHLFHLCCQDER